MKWRHSRYANGCLLVRVRIRPILAVLLSFGTSFPALAAGFRAAAAKVDITPSQSQWLMGYDPRKSTGVHDKIYHRVLAMDDGTTQFFLVSSDLCLFSPTVYDELTRRLQSELGVQPRNVWWAVTHTHAAPEVGPPTVYRALLGRSEHEWNRDYEKQVIDGAVQGIRTAKEKLEPARLSIGTGFSMANINRRAKDVDGSVSLGLNPDGPTDRQIGLLRFERSDGSPIAVVANYAMHGTVMSGENLEISGDGPGVVESYVEEKFGAPVLYVNGAAGNLAPIYSVYPNPKAGHLSQFQVLLGDRIISALQSLGTATDRVTLQVGESTIETPRKAGLAWPEEMAGYSRADAAGSSFVRLPIRFLQINDTLIWSAPVELFCEISNAVRRRSPFTHTFYFGYTNGWFGYLPTSAAFHEGGYEPKTSPFTDSAEKDVLEKVTTYISGLTR
jgi:neutral ceramidase